MRRWAAAAVALALFLTLSACGGEKRTFDLDTTAAAVVSEPGVFSEELERLDTLIALRQYCLEGYLSTRQLKYPPEGYEQGRLDEVRVVAYRSTGATAEEVAVIDFPEEDQAKEYEAWAPTYLDEQRQANVDYRPQEMPKLDEAQVLRRGNTVLILVAADYEAAQRVLK